MRETSSSETPISIYDPARCNVPKESHLRTCRYFKLFKAGVHKHFSSTSTVVALLFASEHRHKMSSRTSTVYISQSTTRYQNSIVVLASRRLTTSALKPRGNYMSQICILYLWVSYNSRCKQRLFP
jgi:hypothetical protein